MSNPLALLGLARDNKSDDIRRAVKDEGLKPNAANEVRGD